LRRISIYDDLVKSPVSHEATEITKRILNIFNVSFFVALWLRVKMLVLTTASMFVYPKTAFDTDQIGYEPDNGGFSLRESSPGR
jgi:hypothetical protein